MYSLSSVASLVCGMNVAEYKHQPSGERDQSFRWISGLHISEVAKLR
jgi:hypothetical protein